MIGESEVTGAQRAILTAIGRFFVCWFSFALPWGRARSQVGCDPRVTAVRVYIDNIATLAKRSQTDFVRPIVGTPGEFWTP